MVFAQVVAIPIVAPLKDCQKALNPACVCHFPHKLLCAMRYQFVPTVQPLIGDSLIRVRDGSKQAICDGVLGYLDIDLARGLASVAVTFGSSSPEAWPPR